jgi:predicted nuclease of predicted toxin-antitoxin system
VALYFADECVATEVVQELRQHGADVVYAKEVCPGASDVDVLRLATTAGRVLVTDDHGFGELGVRQSQPSAGIIILSLYQLPVGTRERRAAARILALGDACYDQLTIVEPGRVRSRPL